MRKITNEIFESLNKPKAKKLVEGYNDTENDIDEAATYLFDEGDIEYLPDYEEFRDSYMEINEETYNKAKERAVKALNTLEEHNYFDDREQYLELNDNHTLWNIDNSEEFVADQYSEAVTEAADEFEERTGEQLYYLGRSGRHVCVIPSYINCIEYDKLCEVQKELEQEVINKFNKTNITESAEDDVTKVTKFLEDSVNDLLNTDYTCSKYNLDDTFAIYVGWSGGYDDDTSDGLIHSKNDSAYRINAIIGVRNEADYADLDYIVQPYYDNGEVYESCQALSEDKSSYNESAKQLLEDYKNIVNLYNEGKLKID
jgi:hypothetical protein